MQNENDIKRELTEHQLHADLRKLCELGESIPRLRDPESQRISQSLYSDISERAASRFAQLYGYRRTQAPFSLYSLVRGQRFRSQDKPWQQSVHLGRATDYFTRDGKPALIVVHTYSPKAEVEAWAHSLPLEVRPLHIPSWFHAGAATPLAISRAQEAA